jgi:hypothetical protein
MKYCISKYNSKDVKKEIFSQFIKSLLFLIAGFTRKYLTIIAQCCPAKKILNHSIMHIIQKMKPCFSMIDLNAILHSQRPFIPQQQGATD